MECGRAGDENLRPALRGLWRGQPMVARARKTRSWQRSPSPRSFRGAPKVRTRNPAAGT